MSQEISAVRVFAKFRPTRSNHEPLSLDIDQTLHQVKLGERLRFRFDGIVDATQNQSQTFEQIGAQSVTELLKGYNATILAYGQTGSGKTHTMLGAGFGEGSAETQKAWDPKGSVAGLMPRVIETLFTRASEDARNTNATIECSMLEIYNEEIRDLLSKDSCKLKLRETPLRGVWVQGLTKRKCHTTSDVLALIQIGSLARSTASTKMNTMSSRSHVVVTITTTQSRMDGSTVRAKLALVDLAGSERVGKTDAKGATLREAQSINQSLSALGNCMRALTTGKANKHIPVRDSKLTHLLRDSLGGNSKTTMVICLASDNENKEETISTLRFGTRAKRIQCSASVNKSGGGLAELQNAVQLLTHQVSVLRKENRSLKNSSSSSSNGNLPKVELQLQAKASYCESLRIQLDSMQHTMKEREATITTLETTKKEITIYSETLLSQLNEIESRQTTTASIMSSQDEQVEAARAAVKSEEERLWRWEAELHTFLEKQQQSKHCFEKELNKRSKNLDEREVELSEVIAAAIAIGKEKTLVLVQEQLEEIFERRMSGLNDRVVAAEDRNERQQKEIVVGQDRLRIAQQRTAERSLQQSKREQEFNRLEKESNVKDGDRMKEMASRLILLETYKKTHEREKTAHLVLSKGDARTTNDLIEQTKNNSIRIKDLEGQLLSLYYVHQNQKEFKAEEAEEEVTRKSNLEEQLKLDEELAQSFDASREEKTMRQSQIEEQMKQDEELAQSFDTTRTTPSRRTPVPRRKTTGGLLSRMFGSKKRNETTSNGNSSTAMTRVSPVNRGRSGSQSSEDHSSGNQAIRDALHAQISSTFGEEKNENEILNETKEAENSGSLKTIILTFTATKGVYMGQIFYYFLGGDDLPLGEDITIGSDPDAIWCLKDDKEILDVHAMISQEEFSSERLRIYPSPYGGHKFVWVNDKQLINGKSIGIKDGDTIVLGSSVFSLCVSYLYDDG